MADKNVNFELVPDVTGQEPDVVSGRATSFVRKESLNGSFGEKSAKKEGRFVMSESKWFARQQNAAIISNELRTKANPHYDVPKTFISHGHVREQFVDGINADKYKGDMSDLIPAVAHFINDMSELRPVQFRRNKKVPGMLLNDIADLDDEIEKVRKFNVVHEKNLQLIHDVYAFLRDMPENNMFVFGHNDLHPGNVFVNPENGRLTVIDFELSGYQPLSYVMYEEMRSGPLLWDYVNKLKRVTNPKLHWNYDANVADLYKFLRRVLYKMENVSIFDKETAAQDLKKINDLCNPAFRKKFAMLKLKYQDSLLGPEMPLVPMLHYER